VRGDKTIPPKMILNTLYNHRTFKFTRSVPFSFDLIKAVKQQMDFALENTRIYSYYPMLDALLLDSEQRYAVHESDSP
jgi:hypothetical protein